MYVCMYVKIVLIIFLLLENLISSWTAVHVLHFMQCVFFCQVFFWDFLWRKNFFTATRICSCLTALTIIFLSEDRLPVGRQADYMLLPYPSLDASWDLC